MHQPQGMVRNKRQTRMGSELYIKEHSQVSSTEIKEKHNVRWDL